MPQFGHTLVGSDFGMTFVSLGSNIALFTGGAESDFSALLILRFPVIYLLLTLLL